MPRPHRVILPGVPQHVVQRGNNKQPIFREFQDYHLFLKHLHEGLADHGCQLHAYVLMTNHVHLLVTPDDGYGIIGMMQHVGRRYVRYFNARHHRTGTLWEGRYKASPIKDTNYLLTCMRYIELNPVRARMVSRPEDYRWSSHLANIGKVTDDRIVPHPLYEALAPDPFERARQYRRSFDLAMADEELQVLRVSIQRCRPIDSA